ncbi:hypothetical protein JOC78_001443 [Bacillus ectoiniformans]|uniref:DUF1871 family protein n=1 Tax=Bacillus ectoiniformans TaxID=1494429 RepID=UPI00195C883D|nr:DUF1871 family protein [Bacillus ectoiniformans]MBM7648497.1 hypothetical protein [Bacillus ectoiniformans]
MDQTIKLNIELGEVIRQWDPFHAGADFYDTEAADVIQAVHQLDDEHELGKKIKDIYEFSFEESLDLVHCIDLAKKLLEIKNRSACEL